MKLKMRIKIGVDFLMSVLLLALMAYQIIGQELHEWFGSGMLVLFILHNILNMRWYKNLFKAKYNPLRVLQTLINFSVLISMLCLGFSGIVMSRHVFAALDIHGPMATARVMHLVASYWGFVLMGVHLGLHWSMVIGIFRKLLSGKKVPVILPWLMRLTAILIAGYGLYSFLKADIASYMFLQNQFVFFDFEQNAISVLTEYIAMMCFWVFVGFYAAKGIGKLSALKTEKVPKKMK